VKLSSLWTWEFQEELGPEHIVRKVRHPKPEEEGDQTSIDGALSNLLINLNTCPSSLNHPPLLNHLSACALRSSQQGVAPAKQALVSLG
jgi:hypothetical protein